MTDKYQVKNVDRLIYTTAISVIEDCTNKIFYNIFNSDIIQFQSNSNILNTTEIQQLKIAIEQLESNYKTQQISPLHIANIDFILGREEYANNQIEQALDKFKNSLSIWKNSTKLLPGEVVTQQINERLEKIGLVLFHIGLCYEYQGNLNIPVEQKNNYWQQAQNNFQQSLDLFAQIDRQELVAKFIIQQGEVLKKLEAWSKLYKLAQHALELHLTYGTEEQIAQDYGFLAEAAMHESKWDHASQLAELAVAIQHQSVDDPLEIAQDQNSYFSILTESQTNLEEWQATVNQLEKARRQTNPHHDLHSYLSILKALKKLYFEQDQYGKSARIKEEKLRIEHQYGLKAFIGINPLQAQQKSDNNPIIPREITVSGRLEDVNNLVERIKSQKHKLIVIHGDSGVGKSSLINSGLIPTLLEENSEDNQVISPILLRVHTDWMRNSDSTTWNLEYVLETLRKNNQKNHVKVLILDQFEEFFTVCPKPDQRLPLYQFLYDCLSLDFVKVVLSIQTDYLHYLFECDRMTNLEAVINYEILSKKILYYISNFEPNQSQEIIKNLIEPAQLNWEPDLISQVVKDLSAADNTVRPIELQVLGTQLQEEGITTVEAYHKLGDNPLQQLTINFIDGVIKDCGFLNGGTAISVLYLLTNEHGTRPLKTRVELASDLLMETNKLDVVLEVLVAQGLVLLLPDLVEDSYQLAHNYLIPLVREQKQEGERSISEFEFERDMM
ncbi:MAG: ATP-binding protein [Cyanobacteriota bacterium]|nr:ATP-binding protein [Cyanobacteriota bacterium]